MSTTKQTVERTGSESGFTRTKLSGRNSPSRGGIQSVDLPDLNRSSLPKLDFDDPKVKTRWKKIIDRQQREGLETDVLQIVKPRAKLDKIAKEVLDGLFARLISLEAQSKEGGDDSSTTPAKLKQDVRAFIVQRGIASEVKKVTQRLNVRRMTDARRWVLAETYVWLLNNLFQGESAKRNESVKRDENTKEDKNAKIDALVQDDLGVAEKIMLDLEADKGPLDTFAQLLVKVVMERNRIGESKTLRRLVAQQVRSVI